MNTEIISFHDHQLITVEQNGKNYVAMKPICEAIGLDWSSQHKRINRDESLSSTMVIMTIVAEDGKLRETLFLELGFLNGWLFKIDASRVKPEIKDTIILYQRECYKVLFGHFHGKALTQHEAYWFKRHPEWQFIRRLSYEGYPYKAIGQMMNPKVRTGQSIANSIKSMIDKGLINPEKLSHAQSGPARLSAQKKALVWGQQSFNF